MGFKRLFSLLVITLQGVAGAAVYNWTNGVNQTAYGPGDTVNIWPTVTNAWSITNSGTAGNPITFFIFGRAFSAGQLPANTTWINFSGQNNIIIDGQTNGVMELTNNGTVIANGGTFTNATAMTGMGGTGLSNITVQNLTLRNFYVRQGTNEGNVASVGGMNFVTCSSLVISNCSFNAMQDCVDFAFGGAPSHDFTLTYCKFTNYNHGLQFAAQGDFAYHTNATITHNRFETGDMFQDSVDFHRDGIISFNDYHTGQEVNMTVAFNWFRAGTTPLPDASGGSAAWYQEFYRNDQFLNQRVYNNVSILTYPLTFSGGGGAHMGAAGNNALIANNTFIAWQTNGAWNGGFCFSIQGSNSMAFNNIAIASAAEQFVGTSPNVTVNSANRALAAANTLADYNVFNGQGNASYYWLWRLDTNLFTTLEGATSDTLSGWTNDYSGTLYPHLDPHSTTNTVTLDANYVPLLTDTVARGQGTNLSAFFTTDYNGNARPATGPWTIGAFEAVSGGNPPTGQFRAITMSTGVMRVGP